MVLDEPELLMKELEKNWARVEEAHERSGVGNLVRPTDLYLTPEKWQETVRLLPGVDLGIFGDRAGSGSGRSGGWSDGRPEPVRANQAESGTFLSQPAPRFHGNVQSMIEEVKKLTAGGTRVILAAPNTGEVERLADIFTEYNASFRLGSRTRGGESYADETAYFAGEVFTTTLLKAYIPDGFILPEAHVAVFGAAIFLTNRIWWPRGRGGRSRKSLRFSPTFAICRLGITWSTSNMASASIRG